MLKRQSGVSSRYCPLSTDVEITKAKNKESALMDYVEKEERGLLLLASQ